MVSFGKILRPTRQEWVLFGLLWLKMLVFFSLVFNSDQVNVSFHQLGSEIFRSLLRPVYHSLVFLIALSLLNLAPGRRKLRAFVGLSLALSGLMALDLWYYRAFRTFPAFSTLSVYRNLSISLDQVATFIRPGDLLLLLDLALLLPLRHLLTLEGPTGWRRFLAQAGAFTGLFFLVAPVAWGVIGSKAAREPFSIFDPVSTSIMMTPLGYHALDLATFARSQGPAFVELSESSRARIGAWLRDNRERRGPGPLQGALAGRNLLIIQVESLEFFMLDRTVNGVPVTPVLNALKRQGLCFTDYHEQVGLGVSADSDLMTNTSVYPVRNLPTFCAYPTATLPSLPRILGQAGYATLSLHPDKGSLWNVRQGHVNLGFQRILDCSAFDCSDSFGMGLSDASYLAQSVPIISGLKEPFYTFMVTQSSHLPFEPPDYLRELPLDPDLDREVMGGYFQSVHYTDKHLGIFLDRLRRTGLLDRTVVVVTGDHQGVHKYCKQEIHASSHFQPWWEEPDRKLPFLIVAKGLAPREIALHAGQVDVMPTLLALLGVDAGVWGDRMMGRNLLNTGRNQVVLADGTLKGEAGAAEAAHCKEGLEVADLIIRGNYFQGDPVTLKAKAHE